MINSRTPTRIPYAGVICRQHGQVDIEKDEYVKQMSDPHARWKCPICKQFAEFNETRYDELHPEE